MSKPPKPTSFAEALKKVRLQRKLSQPDLAKASQGAFSQNAISCWERGQQPGSTQWPGISKSLGLEPGSPEYLDLLTAFLGERPVPEAPHVE